jgi:hypothetical protein
VRVISNLSRHKEMCEMFVEDKRFIEMVSIALDNNLRDLVFYSIGIIINITMHEKLR